MTELNATHNPALRSWVPSAHQAGGDFPIQNLPLGAFRSADGASDTAGQRCGVAIGDRVLDVGRIADLLPGLAAEAVQALRQPHLNALMALGPAASAALRSGLSQMLAEGWQGPRERVEAALLPIGSVAMAMPFRVSGYTDFFASVHHATNAGRLFRADQPLLPNYKYVPVAYNGRANSLRVSGDAVTRPHGQLKPVVAGEAPLFAPSQRMDYEVELGIVVGAPSASDCPVVPGDAWRHVFGFCLLNDWSARDIQAWEYQPLGPFLGKSFATSISPWIVTAKALLPYRTAAAVRPAGDPSPMPHLFSPCDQARGGLSIQLDAELRTARMRERGLAAHRLSRSDTATLYWTVAQMVAHHTSNGCALDTADVLGSGTVSGPAEDALGSLLEITRGGAQAIALASGEERRFLEDGDELCLKGFCEAPGRARIGFGECWALLLPARAEG